MGSPTERPLHAVFLPYMAPGHMMPLVDIARVFAAHGLRVTIITTKMNAQSFKNAIERDIRAGHQIAIEVLHFPAIEAGLPEGCENISKSPTPEMTIKLFHAIEMLQPQIEELIRKCSPDCIASDVLFYWTTDVAAELGIPRLAFSGSGFFNMCVAYCIEHHQPHKHIKLETEPFVVPNMPDQLVLTRSQLPDIVKTRNKFSELFDKLKEAERKSFGMLVNSFYELETAYADYHRKVIGIKAWHVGPVSLLKGGQDDKAERGDEPSVSKHSCLSWLNSKKPNSVLYICFGSLTRFSKTQLNEIASALESTGQFFIWVVGKVLGMDKKDEEEEWWLPDGFEDKMVESGKGMIIRGWAPQVLILEHPAIGGILTHCGWNSILEGVAAGLPMITWPIFAEQFYNEKLVTQVLKIGVPVGNEVWKAWATEETSFISREKIERAISKAMCEREDGEQMRKKAKRLGELARKAVEEGGSSHKDLKILIEEIKCYARKKASFQKDL
ncbi:hypothetical protein RJ640_006960 [Escallonia rubra]|uniref:Glycosyltransferase N-terminal domain-containing protein n=1 Tax=Escallonia rubra TaxID=112253 RepID=A0AA88UUB2_9ASTE|nr:hypothetical protein RJ640_006960 [Escallonia rubra]